MKTRGPAPLLLGLLIAVGVPQALNLAPVRRALERDDMARVLAHTRTLEASPAAEILLMGNSRMGEDVDAEVLSEALGVPVANLALAGATPSQQEAWLRRLLARPVAPPRRILLALSPVDLSARFPGRERAGRYLHDVRDLGPLLAQGRDGEATALVDHLLFPAYRFRLELKDTLKRAPPLEARIAAQRAEEAALLPEQRELASYTESWLPDFRVDPAEEKALRAFLALAKARGIRVTLVRLPVAGALLAHERKVASPRFEDLMRALGEGVDLATPEAAGRYRFADCNHLEAPERARFSRDLAARLPR